MKLIKNVEGDAYSRYKVKHHSSNWIAKKWFFKVSCDSLLIVTKEPEKIFGKFRHLSNMFLMILSKVLIY